MKHKPLSPKQYIKTKARNLPIDGCYLTNSWKETGMASIIVARKHTNNNYTFGIFLVDLFALGTKDTFFHFNVNGSELDKILNKIGEGHYEKVAYPLVHNIIYGANAFAEDNGFKIHSDFELTQYILEEDTDDIEFMEIEFGRNGEPLLLF